MHTVRPPSGRASVRGTREHRPDRRRDQGTSTQGPGTYEPATGAPPGASVFEKGKEVSAEKMTGTDEDVAKFRPVSTELAAVCVAASS